MMPVFHNSKMERWTIVFNSQNVEQMRIAKSHVKIRQSEEKEARMREAKRRGKRERERNLGGREKGVGRERENQFFIILFHQSLPSLEYMRHFNRLPD
jgi:hypothetical protein